jgi:ornithine carbamoyltransferase
MAPRHLLSISDLQSSDLQCLLERSLELKRGPICQTLKGKIIGLYFLKTSTRTRTSFAAAAYKLGANVLTYGPNDLQTNTGETLEDTARVLSSFLEALVIRTSENVSEMRKLAQHGSFSVINAMSNQEHPTQSLADVLTMLEHFGDLKGKHVLYMGEGNSTAAALALAMSLMPEMRLSLFTPPGYGVPLDFLNKANEFCRESGTTIEESHDLKQLPANVDVVYTARWQTTGSCKPSPDWRTVFQPFRVTSALMTHVSRRTGTVFMHDLPAVRGEEVDAEVLDGPQSIAFRQAANKLHSAMAVLEWCLAYCDPHTNGCPPSPSRSIAVS